MKLEGNGIKNGGVTMINRIRKDKREKNDESSNSENGRLKFHQIKARSLTLRIAKSLSLHRVSINIKGYQSIMKGKIE